jgi:hypothetical protein
MNKLKVIITYKGKQYCFMFEDEKMTINYKIHVLLSNKDSKNDHTLASSHYHYVCKLYNGYMLIPETSLLPHESLDNNEYGIYFKRGKDYYLNITNPLFTNETEDVITYLRKRGYEKELDRFK